MIAGNYVLVHIPWFNEAVAQQHVVSFKCQYALLPVVTQ